ncbi:hypothetical protein VOLCADRAFT_117751 [Volvox carteri f. nagariensis]|uniref:Autophagy-related protein 101 n=1 Tax=Volvox carteri f. nagariensis TaxID=3068 RepID=D8TXB7_VOLCA|nr:uncharacterized protein VOLCADRAFT_117751 [Volvox carteri f. nagariensis]EFJ47979.1 hypothetical protein VOLCADRAFT_117751 [Volvox carteri f. nagariensis]|eukprot:XP_002951085.1 hypothetical protein VOLCADRAFT_117751 [Volvox carteri f. nagariensis]
MANCETHNLPVLELEPHQIREALRCVLHTIIFNRALGYVIPTDVDSELFDITYVQCGEPGVEARVESRISDFCAQVEKKPAELHQLHLSFYETRRKQAWFGTQDERLYWETCALEEQLAIVVRRVNDRRDHIPPVLSPSAVTFPFDITFSGSSTRGSLQGGLQAVGKMLMKATPPPVLG